MRRTIRALLISVLAASCGGGDSVSPPPPPPTPPGSGPSSIAVQAGDGQEADPGAPLPIQPSVLVRDGASRPLSGVVVSFSVDSGGGHVASASSTTDAGGVATSGVWTLGPGEGSNLLTASVIRVGAAPLAVKLRANARVPKIQLSDTLLPAGGGTITYAKPGDPQDGFSLSVPAGAYATPQRWLVESKPSLKVSLPAEVTQIGGGIVVGNDQGYSDSLIVIRMPARVGLDTALAAFYYDPATQYLDPAPLVSRDAQSISLAVRHLDTRFLWQSLAAVSPAAGAVAHAAAGFGQVTFILVALPTSKLNNPVTTGFVPGIDDWEFANWGSELSPGGICAGMSISALYYFSRIKPGAGRGLFHRYDVVPNFDWDNPQGLRFASMIQHRLISGAWTAMRNRMIALAQQSQLTLDQLSYQSLVIAMRTTSRPQPFGMDAGPGAGGGHEVIAYGAGGGTIKLADPNQPGAAGVTASFVGNRFLPIQLQPNAGATAQPYTRVFVYGSSSAIPTPTIDTEWQRFASGIAGNGTFMALNFESNDDELNPAYQPLGDSVSVWSDYLGLGAECPTCTPKHYFGLLYNRQGGAVRTPIRPAGPLRDSIGVELLVNNSFSNFKWTLVKARQFEVEPQGASFAVQRAIGFVARPFGPAPAGARYVWNFGDSTALATVVDDSTVHHVFQRVGDVQVKVELRDASGRKLAVAATDLTVGGPIWRIDSVGVSQSGPAFQGQSEADTAYHNAVVGHLNALIASPGDNHIIAREVTAVWQQVEAGRGATVTGYLDDMPICALGAEGTGALSVPCHFFIASGLNYTLGTVGNGVLTGQYSISDPGEPYYAGFLNTITATMTPGFLRGQITIASFAGGTGPVYTIKFRAVEVVP